MEFATTTSLLIALIVGYTFGAIPFGVLLTQAAGLGDIRKIGSGNIGATNVLRTGNKPLAVATLLGDMLKGTVAVIIGWFIATKAAPAPMSALTFTPMHAAGLGAFLGHLFPVWLGFKGGKGVATYIGILIGLNIQLAVAFALLWLCTAFATRISSLAALIAAFLIPLVGLLLSNIPTAATLGIMSLMLIAKHHANIRRLMSGTEPRIKLSKDTAS